MISVFGPAAPAGAWAPGFAREVVGVVIVVVVVVVVAAVVVVVVVESNMIVWVCLWRIISNLRA